MAKVKVMTVFGTRPEAIKMAPVVLALKKRTADFDTVTVVTGQHREMLQQVLDIFKIVPDYDLHIMHQNQTLADITTRVLENLGAIIVKEKPDILLVHGDTTTTFAAAISAYYQQVKVGHVEAGLRTWNKYSPFPEEMNHDILGDDPRIQFWPTCILRRPRPAGIIY